MSSNPPSHNNGKRFYKRIVRVLLWITGCILLLIIIIIILVQTPFVQNLARAKAQRYLSEKLHTRVEIKELRIKFPTRVSLGGVIIEDRQKDTLLSGKRLEMGINMWKLFHGELVISTVELRGITAKVKRALPDTSFNFQFIIDAFASKNPAIPKDPLDTSSMVITLKAIRLDSIRLVYQDVVTGNDVEAWLGHVSVNMKDFNTATRQFNIASLEMTDSRARYYRTAPAFAKASAGKPVESSTNAANEQRPTGNAPFYAIGDVLLNHVLLDYRDSVDAFYTNIALGHLAANVKDMDIDHQLIRLNSITLDQTTAAVLLGKKAPVPVVKASPADVSSKAMAKAGVPAQAGWHILATTIALNNNNLQYDDNNNRPVASGMDYSHIKATGVTLHAADLLYGPDSISGNIRSGSLREKSGFELSRLQTKFLYASHQAYLENLDLRTPHTLLRDFVRLRYPSLAAFKNNPGGVELDLQLRNSQLQLKDALYFAPQLAKQELFRRPNDILHVNTRVKGTLDNMNVQQLQLSGIGSTVIDIAGTLRHPTDAKRFSADLRVNNLSTTKKDLEALLPPGSLPSNISLPQTARMSGTLTGGTAAMNANLLLVTSSGTVLLKGYLRPLNDIKNASYDLHLEARGLDLAYILQDTLNFGTLSGVFNAKGRGMDQHHTHAVANGNISVVTLRRYEYHNLQLNASANGDEITATATANDPNIRFNLDLQGNMANKYPAVQTTLQIDTINTLALHLTDSLITYHGTIVAGFSNTDPDQLDGKLTITGSRLQNIDRHIALDTIQLLAGALSLSKGDSGRFINLTTETATLRLYGQYRLTQMGDVFKQVMDPYYAVGDSAAKKTVDPYNFYVKGNITETPLLKTFVPDLKKLSPVTLDGHFSNADTIKLSLNAPLIIIGTNQINDLQLHGNGSTDKLALQLSLAHAKSGGLDIFATTLQTDLANNKAAFALNNKDVKGKDRYHLEGILEHTNEQYGFSLQPGKLLLNYNNWNVNPDNKIVIGKGDVDVHRFELSRNAEKMIINTAGEGANDSLRVQFENFKIATLSSFAMSDSSRFNGILQGDVTIHDLEKSPTFTSNLLVNNFEAAGDTLGNVHITVNNATPQVFAANLGITGQGNDIQVTGTYDNHPHVAKPLQLAVDIKKLELHSLEGVTGNQVKNASGHIAGKMTIGGSIDKPDVRGLLNFNNTKFNLAILNSYFAIDSEQIAFDETGFNFDTFTIIDSTGNEAVVDGNVYTTDYRNYKFDFDLIANNFHALNTTKKNNKNYYGQLYFDSRLSVKGTPSQPAIDGRVAINDKTNLTISVPQNEPGVEERKGIVEFVDHNGRQADSTAALSTDSLLAASLAGMDISVNFEIKKEAQVNILIDPDNGDMLSVKGEAQLNGGIDPGGNLILTGSYELAEGTYNLTFNLLHRKFNIKKGSTIVWKGAPTEAEADITAVYNIDAPPIDLMQQTSDQSNVQANMYRQKLPFQVQLTMKGPIFKPTITFDILLPEDRSYSISGDYVANINYRLEELRKEPSELNKQVFALLLLGRFVGENPFQSSVGGMTAESFARKSASALLADQLNQLAGSLIKGVDINFDVVSEDDYSSGERLNRTDVNVALSKRLFNDRLTVTVGNNFELEGPQQASNQASALAGSIAVDYKLSKDGRYQLRAYRKNGYQGVIEGYVVETGVGFVITLDYNKFKEIFHSRKARKNSLTPRAKKKKPSSPGQSNP